MRRFPRLPWIADISDPFSFLENAPVNNHHLYANLNRMIEERVVRHSTSVTVTMRSTFEAYKQYFPRVPSRFRIAPPLWLSSDRVIEPVPKLGGGSRRLVYTGTLYPKVRNPQFLLDTFRRLLQRREFSDLELHFFGQINGCQTEFRRHSNLIGSKIYLHGQVPQETIREQFKGSLALVNLGNQISYGLPSKLIEYVSSGRPILNFPPQQPDTSTEFLSDYPAVFNVHPQQTFNSDRQFDQLVRFLQEPAQVEQHSIDRMLAAHRVDAVAEVYERALRSSWVSRQSA